MRLSFYLVSLIMTIISSKSTHVKCTEIAGEENNKIRSNQKDGEATTQSISDSVRATAITDNSTNLNKNNSDSKPISNQTTTADLQQPGNNNNAEDIFPIQVIPGFDYQSNNNFPYRKEPWKFFQYFNPSTIVGSLSQKINKLSNLLTYPYNPNDGIINFLNPSYLFKILGDKSQELLSNPNSAIFGFGQFGGHDYPFPYRSSLFYNST